MDKHKKYNTDSIQKYNVTIQDAITADNLALLTQVAEHKSTDLTKDLLEGLYIACSKNNEEILKYLTNLCIVYEMKIDNTKCYELMYKSKVYNKNMTQIIWSIPKKNAVHHAINTSGWSTYDVCFLLNAVSIVFEDHYVIPDYPIGLCKQRFIRVFVFEDILNKVMEENCSDMYDKNILPLISAYIEYGE